MTAYQVTTRIVELAEGHWIVSATAYLTAAPRQGVVTRQHECSSSEQANDFLEILVDQVASAVKATGGEVVAIVAA